MASSSPSNGNNNNNNYHNKELASSPLPSVVNGSDGDATMLGMYHNGDASASSSQEQQQIQNLRGNPNNRTQPPHQTIMPPLPPQQQQQQRSSIILATTSVRKQHAPSSSSTSSLGTVPPSPSVAASSSKSSSLVPAADTCRKSPRIRTTTTALLFFTYAFTSITLTLINKYISIYLRKQEFLRLDLAPGGDVSQLEEWQRGDSGADSMGTVTSSPSLQQHTHNEETLRNFAQNNILVMQNCVAMLVILFFSCLYWWRRNRFKKDDHTWRNWEELGMSGQQNGITHNNDVTKGDSPRKNHHYTGLDGTTTRWRKGDEERNLIASSSHAPPTLRTHSSTTTTPNNPTAPQSSSRSLLSFFKVNSYKWRHIRMISPLIITFTLMLYSSLKLMGTVPISTIVVFRNIGTLVVALCDRNKKFTTLHWVSLISITAGAFIYHQGTEAATDTSHPLSALSHISSGIKWAILNQTVVTVNALLEKRITTTIRDQTPTGISLFLNVSSLVSFSVYTLILYSTSGIGRNTSKSLIQLLYITLSVFPWYYLVLSAASGVLAMGIGMSYFALNSSQSPTSIKIVNNLARLVSVLMAAFIFGDALSFISFIGMVVCLGAGLAYSIGG